MLRTGAAVHFAEAQQESVLITYGDADGALIVGRRLVYCDVHENLRSLKVEFGHFAISPDQEQRPALLLHGMIAHDFKKWRVTFHRFHPLSAKMGNHRPGSWLYPEPSSSGKVHPMQKITPCLWFDGNAEDAMSFYASVFPDFRHLTTTPGPENKPLVMTCRVQGQEFILLNGGRNSSSAKRFPFPSCVTRKMKWTTCGTSCRQAEKR